MPVDSAREVDAIKSPNEVSKQFRTQQLLAMIDPATRALQNSIAKSKIDRSRSLTDAERLRGGADLYDEGMWWLTLTIQGENPEFTPEQVDAEIERRKAIIRQIDDNGLYQDSGMAETHDEEACET